MAHAAKTAGANTRALMIAAILVSGFFNANPMKGYTHSLMMHAADRRQTNISRRESSLRALGIYI